jgi:hypothetical protein
MKLEQILHLPMDHSAHNMNDMQGMNMSGSTDIVTLSYDMLRSPVKTILPDGPKKTLNFYSYGKYESLCVDIG